LIADPGLDHAHVDAIFAARREEILAVANMMHLTIVHLPQLYRHRALSPRQREALEWVADGKTRSSPVYWWSESTCLYPVIVPCG
jgi:hypothetical protein